MFHTATVRPKRWGPNILYNTSLNPSINIVVLARAMCSFVTKFKQIGCCDRFFLEVRPQLLVVLLRADGVVPRRSNCLASDNIKTMKGYNITFHIVICQTSRFLLRAHVQAGPAPPAWLQQACISVYPVVLLPPRGFDPVRSPDKGDVEPSAPYCTLTWVGYPKNTKKFIFLQI